MTSPNFPRRRSKERGSAVLLAVVIVSVLTILSLAVIQMSSNEMDSANAKRHYDETISCADAARELLQSQFSTYGSSPVTMQLDRVVGDQRMTTGHYDNLAVVSVKEASGAASGSLAVSDSANRLTGPGGKLGGQVYRMTVVCSSKPLPTDPVGMLPRRQSEVEFVVRFGL